jgi:hypothetical protein
MTHIAAAIRTLPRTRRKRTKVRCPKAVTKRLDGGAAQVGTVVPAGLGRGGVSGSVGGRMKKHVYDDKSNKLIEIVEAEPVCGEDFCDSCGDCLHCYGGDECLEGYGGEHYWVEYREAEAADAAEREVSDEKGDCKRNK